MSTSDAPYHAHIYYDDAERERAERLREELGEAPVEFVGRLADRPVGPHPIPQFEVHFLERNLSRIISLLEASRLRVLVHPLTDDDLADHTTLGSWIGEPVKLDTTVLDPPGHNQGVERFGKTDF